LKHAAATKHRRNIAALAPKTKNIGKTFSKIFESPATNLEPRIERFHQCKKIFVFDHSKRRIRAEHHV
jgi:hypothetical protein